MADLFLLAENFISLQFQLPLGHSTMVIFTHASFLTNKTRKHDIKYKACITDFISFIQCSKALTEHKLVT